MPDHHGYRSRTRNVFSKTRSGMPKPNKYLNVYRLGDYVTIKMDSAVQKGMAHRIYHGKTGVVWNVTKRAVGVLLKKKVGNRYRTKKLHVRIEHIKPSKCRDDFIKRCNFNRRYKELHSKDKKKYPKISLIRSPKGFDPDVTVDTSLTSVVDLKISPHVDVVKL